MKSMLRRIFKEENKHEMTPMHTKSKRLWTSLLKDPKTKFTTSLITKDIHLENSNFLLCLNRMNEVDYLLTIFNINSNRSYMYELALKSNIAQFFIDSFNEENETRLEKTKMVKISLINRDMEKLCNQFTVLD